MCTLYSQSPAVQYRAVHLLSVHMYSGQLYRRHTAAVSAECCDNIGLEYWQKQTQENTWTFKSCWIKYFSEVQWPESEYKDSYDANQIRSPSLWKRESDKKLFYWCQDAHSLLFCDWRWMRTRWRWWRRQRLLNLLETRRMLLLTRRESRTDANITGENVNLWWV